MDRPLIGAGVVAAALLALAPGAASPQKDELACKQEPGNRWFWLERAFCDVPVIGPERALGAVVWNHGIYGTLQSWMAPAPPVLRLLQGRGWDVIMIKRHNAAEVDGRVVYRTVQRTLQEVTALKKSGYRKVVLAGQSFGGYVALEALDTSPEIDAVLALAPGLSYGATSRLDESVIERILMRAKAGRLALVLPKNDSVFGNVERGERTRAILSRRSLPYLLVDEKSEISGHGGGVTGRFALRYGACVAEFLAAAELRPGPFVCPPVTDEWSIVQELLRPSSAEVATFVREASAFPEPVGALLGPRWALLEDTVVLVAPTAPEPGKLRLLYRSTGIGGGVYEATVKGGAIHAQLPNKSSVMLKPEGDGTIVWTASDGSRSVNAPLLRGREGP